MEQRISFFTETPKGFMDSLAPMGAYLYNSSLDLKLRDLIAYRVSQINGCAFCLDMHHKEAIHHGETEQRLHGLAAWRESPYYSEEERAALQMTDILTRQCELDDASYQLLEKHFSKAEIADLALAVAATNTWNRLNITFRTTAGNYRVNQFKPATV